MPPLGSQRFVERPKPTQEQIALRRQVERSRVNTYDRMGKLLPETGSGALGRIGVGKIVSSKAVYRLDDKPRGVYTRAWLEGSGGSITLITDEVRLVGGKASVVEGSEFEHLTLAEGGKVKAEEYQGIGHERALELMNGVGETLDLIQEATLADAAVNA